MKVIAIIIHAILDLPALLAGVILRMIRRLSGPLSILVAFLLMGCLALDAGEETFGKLLFKVIRHPGFTFRALFMTDNKVPSIIGLIVFTILFFFLTLLLVDGLDIKVKGVGILFRIIGLYRNTLDSMFRKADSAPLNFAYGTVKATPKANKVSRFKRLSEMKKFKQLPLYTER